MKILATSDSHGYLDGLDQYIATNKPDVVVLAGDIQPCEIGVNAKNHVKNQLIPLMNHHSEIEFVYTPGNHDFWVNSCKYWMPSIAPVNFHMLIDSGCVIDGIRFWGSPWVPYINGVWVFESEHRDDESDIRRRFEAIPSDTDVLITHSPPRLDNEKLDFSLQTNRGPFGSISLAEQYLTNRIRPKVHFCGHIHSGTHDPVKVNDTIIYNVSRVDEKYDVTYLPTIVNI